MHLPRFFKVILIGGLLSLAGFATVITLLGGNRSFSLTPQASIPATAEVFASLAPTLDTNFTTTLSDNLAGEIEKKNPQGPTATTDGFITLNAAAVVQKTLQEQLKNFNQDSLWPDIDEGRLTITQDANSKDVEVYLGKLKSILSLLETSKVNEDLGRSDFQTLAKDRETAFRDLYATAAPRELLTTHYDLLRVLGAQRNVFTLLAEHQNDPLKAALAYQFQEQVATAAVELGADLSEYLTAHKLTL